jgi:hypothetical protein
MNNYLLTLSSLALVSSFAAIGCGGAIRAGDAYRDDTMKLVSAQANPKIHDCFDGMVKSTPGSTSLQGTTTVSFTVAKETGAITSPTIVAGSTTTQDPVNQCVLASLAGLKLDPPDNVDGNATFTWQFVVEGPK